MVENELNKQIEKFYQINKQLIEKLIEKMEVDKAHFYFINETIENIFSILKYYSLIDFSLKDQEYEKGEILMLHLGYISSINQIYNLYLLILKIYNKKFNNDLDFYIIKDKVHKELCEKLNDENEAFTIENLFDNFNDLRGKLEHSNDRNILSDNFFYGSLVKINEDNSFVNITYNCNGGTKTITYDREGLELVIMFYNLIVNEIIASIK